MYWTTESAGRTGSLIIVIFVSIAFGLTARFFWPKVAMTLRTFVVLSFLLTAFAYVNEHFIKATLRIARPSHTYIITQSQSKTPLDSIYSLMIDGRRTFLKNLIDSDTVHFKTIDQRILNHWVEEAGYSFPSGHSFNAFLIGTILAFAIFEFTGRRLTVWSYVPLIWAALVAVSRVAIGAHTALDVTAGSALGLISAHLLLFILPVRKLILPDTIRLHKSNDQK